MSFYYPDGEGGKKLIVMESTYSLPTASKTTKGGIKPGNALEMNNDTLNAIAMTGAISLAAGKSGLAPAPAKGQQNTFLCGNGEWSVPPYMPLSGGTFTGNVYLGTDSAPTRVILPTVGSGIGKRFDSEQFSGMKFMGRHDKTETYGYDVLVQGGQELILSAGEGGCNAYKNSVAGANSIAGSDENLYLMADYDVVIMSNCENISKGKKFTFDTAGNLTANKFTGDLEGNATSATKDGLSNIIASTYVKNITPSNGALTLTKGDNSTVSVPISAKIKTGNGLSMSDDGTLNRDSTFTDRITLKAGFNVPASVSGNFASNSTISAERKKVDFSYVTLEADHTSIRLVMPKSKEAAYSLIIAPNLTMGLELKLRLSLFLTPIAP